MGTLIKIATQSLLLLGLGYNCLGCFVGVCLRKQINSILILVQPEQSVFIFPREKKKCNKTSWHNVIKEPNPALLFANIIDILIQILHICIAPDKDIEDKFRKICEIIHDN